MSSLPRVGRDGVSDSSSSSDGPLQLHVYEDGGALRSFIVDISNRPRHERVLLPAGEPSRVSPLVDYLSRGVGEPSSRSGRRLRVVSDRRRPAPRQARQPAVRAPPAVVGRRLRVVSDRRRPAPRQARLPAVRAPPAVLCVNPRGATPRPAAAEDTMASRDDLVGVYKGGCLLYLTHRRTFNQADHPGVTLSWRVGTTPDGDDYGEIVRRARSHSLPGRCGAEGASRHGVHRSPSAGEPLNLYRQPDGATSGNGVDSAKGMQIFVPKINDKQKFPQDGTGDIVESFGKLKLSEVKKELQKMEKNFIHLIESGDKAMERQLVDAIHSLSDNQGITRYSYLVVTLVLGWNIWSCLIQVVKVIILKLIQEEEDDEDDLNYDPAHDDDDEDDDDDYMNGLAQLPPLPPGTYYWNGITMVDRIGAVRDLNPEFHILGFGSNLTIHERIRLWATGDTMGFDFQPTEMLRYVWRLELLLNGENPGNLAHSVNEPPVPNPGDYDEGWTTDEEMVFSDMEEEDLDLENGSNDMDED
uniref:Uncharacterized protein n=1 Tax=Setaria italica TaxID=4555 RepID=K4AJ93_SETIT